MKRPGRILNNLLAMLLTMTSLQAFAETQLGGRDFNHATTGFPLSGAHATAACETCHVGGVFKGTPRNCDDCHALGKRIVATPKSTSHIVTNAPCESCHFNTATFFGARYNHAAAIPGQCMTCHNGRQAAGRPSTHSSGRKATDSCDHCHRSIAWTPASWNHIGVTPGSCTTCHNGSTAIGKPASHTPVSIKGTNQCDDCHSFTGWFPARFKHNTGAACSSCHNGTLATGKPSGHIATTDECNQCHYSTIAWIPALGAKPANHIPYNAGAQCKSCHIGTTVATGSTLHAYVYPGFPCKTCHNTTPVLLGSMERKTIGSHEGSTNTQDCISCHATQYNQWNNP